MLPSPFYADDTLFNGFTSDINRLLRPLLDWVPDQGYFPKPSRSLFIADSPTQEEEARQDSKTEILKLKFMAGS